MTYTAGSSNIRIRLSMSITNAKHVSRAHPLFLLLWPFIVPEVRADGENAWYKSQKHADATDDADRLVKVPTAVQGN